MKLSGDCWETIVSYGFLSGEMIGKALTPKEVRVKFKILEPVANRGTFAQHNERRPLSHCINPFKTPPALPTHAYLLKTTWLFQNARVSRLILHLLSILSFFRTVLFIWPSYLDPCLIERIKKICMVLRFYKHWENSFFELKKLFSG